MEERVCHLYPSYRRVRSCNVMGRFRGGDIQISGGVGICIRMKGIGKCQRKILKISFGF